MKDINIKRQLLDICIVRLRESLKVLHTAMNEAQAEANEHKGAMASRYDTFKQEAQALRDGYARQIQDVGDVLATLEQLDLSEGDGVIALGSVVETDDGNFFVSTGLLESEVMVDNKRYRFVGFSAPIIQEFRKNRIGQSILFHGQNMTLKDIW